MTRRTANPPAAVLFDWDGTLVDSRAALLAAWRAATSSVLGRLFPATAEEEQLVWSMTGQDVLPILTDDRAAVRTMQEVFQHEYSMGGGSHLTTFRGVPELLDTLRATGIRIGVVTAKARIRYDADIAHLGLTHRIDLAVCADDVTHPKPHPQGISQTLRALALSPSQAVFVGDTPLDIEAATAATVDSIGVSWGFAEATRLHTAGATTIVHNTTELLEEIMHIPH